MRPARRDGDGRSGGVTGDVNEWSRLCRGYTEGTMPKPPQFVAAVVAGLTVRVVGGHEAIGFVDERRPPVLSVNTHASS
jgi:hypothetical protein